MYIYISEVIKLDNFYLPLFLRTCCVNKKGENEVKIFDIRTFIEAENILLFVPILLFTGTKASLNIYTPSTAGITLLDPCSSL